ncbi:MAG: SPOR domain-containing protein [Prevotella sp.]|nr:SPOR domain-containing protein [Prevotella sp.]
MIELNRHIEILLLTNDCVIVPDFGGFITHNVASRYDESDKSFLPPLRTLGFNPQLRMNDSVLVQSYVEAYDISYPEALRRIEEEVAELKHQLEEEGQYTLEDLGELSINQEGNYEFTPCESGILSPDLYGLGAFSFKRLKGSVAEEVVMPKAAPKQAATVALLDQNNEQPAEAEPRLLDFTDSDDADTAISIKMSWVRNAVAIAAAVVAFFFIATPVANSDLGTQTMSQLQHSILYKLIPQDTTLPAVEPVITETVDAKPVTAKETMTTETKTVAAPKPAVTYCIVVASQVKLSNAEKYVEKLKSNGYPNAEVYISNNIVRVISAEFATEAEAYRQLNKMNMQEEFYEAWVYKKVNG